MALLLTSFLQMLLEINMNLICLSLQLVPKKITIPNYDKTKNCPASDLSRYGCAQKRSKMGSIHYSSSFNCSFKALIS